MNIIIPTLLIDKSKCLANIRNMAEKARRNGVRLRPHFKTHQSAQVGAWFREEGINAITVSSLRMARYFARHGWTDITVAFPVNILEADLINELAADITLHLIVVNQESVGLLQAKLYHPVKLWLKIDTGYKRTGIPTQDIATIESILQEISTSKLLYFQGFLSHDGHTYKQTQRSAIQAIHDSTVSQLNELAAHFRKDHPDLQLSIGDTPSCSIVDPIKGVDEIRPGNYVFYDLAQQHIGSCTFKQIAVCMACPIVAMHPERNEIILYGGSVHFSKDVIIKENGNSLFGLVVDLSDTGWSEPLTGIELVSLSQEHGIVRASNEHFKKYKVGDVMGVLPIHSCLTADIMKSYKTLEGEKLEHLSGLPEYIMD